MQKYHPRNRIQHMTNPGAETLEKARVGLASEQFLKKLGFRTVWMENNLVRLRIKVAQLESQGCHGK